MARVLEVMEVKEPAPVESHPTKVKGVKRSEVTEDERLVIGDPDGDPLTHHWPVPEPTEGLYTNATT